jgi:hypothetical protein
MRDYRLVLLLAVVMSCSPTSQSAKTPTVESKEKPAAAKKQKKPAGAVPDAGEDLGDADDAPTAAAPAPSPVVQPAAPATPPPPAVGGDPNVVQFTIRAGTGRGAWNTPQTPIKARVGQTLVIKNEDSINHWIHTNFGPFFHPISGIAPGQSATYRINTPNAQGMRDHLNGGAIYMEVSR